MWKTHLIIGLIIFGTVDAFMYSVGGASVVSETLNSLYVSLDHLLDNLHQWWYYG